MPRLASRQTLSPIGLFTSDLDTEQEVLDVWEVNTEEGWLVSFRRDARGYVYPDPDKEDELARQRIEGRFEIRIAE